MSGPSALRSESLDEVPRQAAWSASTVGAPAPGGLSALARVLRLGRPVTRRLALAVLAGVAAAGSAIGLTATSAWLISRAAEQPPVLYLLVAVTSVRAFGISRGVCRYAERLASHDAAFRVLGHLRSDAYGRLERLAPSGLLEFRSGDLLARLIDDVDCLADLWLRLLIPYLIAIAAAAGTVFMIWFFSPWAALALGVSVLFVAIAIPIATIAVARAAERRISTTRGELASATLELLNGAPELLVAGATEGRLADLAALDRSLARAEAGTSAGLGLGAMLSSLATGAAVWLSLVAGIAAVRSDQMGGLVLALVALTPIALHENIGSVVPAAQHLPGLAAMASRVVEVVSRPLPVVEPATPEPLPAGPFGLRARGVRARYGSGLPHALVLPDLDLAAGRRMLVTGTSGSGKSTLAAVLVRFLEPSSGTLELVGADRSIDIRCLTGDDVRKAVCLCEQDPHVFDTSILENVRLARPGATDEEIRLALARAQLAGWIDSLPDGLETMVGEHGAQVSGGQRQRLSLARALLADAPVIVFDEPTEHLDEETAAALTADLLAATSGRTVVMITHRPELIASSDWNVRVELGQAAVERPTVEVG